MAKRQHTLFSPRPAPFGTIRKVPPFEAAHWVDARCAHARLWTHEQTDMLATLLDSGHSVAGIARRLGRTPTAVRVRMKRLGWTLTGRPTVLTAREVAALLGIRGSEKRVTGWVARGWLRAQPRGSGQHNLWAIQWDDLIAFLHNEQAWMAWEPERIADADLRAELLALRASRPAWLSVGQVAQRYHVGVGTVGQWLRKGWLPFVRYGNHYIRESDLVGWVVPIDRPRAGVRRGHPRPHRSEPCPQL